jgi:hypothetical protein
MKLKSLDGISLNDLVLLNVDGTIHKVVRIDGHVRPFCLDKGGRVSKDCITFLQKSK